MTKSKKIIVSAVAAFLTVGVTIGAVLTLNHIKDERETERWLAEMKKYYEAKVSAFAEENERYADYEVDVAFLGDSLTDGYDLSEYYPQYLTANRGIGGDTTHGLEARLGVSVYELKPKVAVMLIGANNPHTMFENYEDILIGFRENLPQTKIVLLSMTSMGADWGRNNNLAAFNSMKIKALAEKYGYSFVDVYTPLLNVETDEIYAEYTSDGGHLTPEGYRVLTDAVAPILDSLLSDGK